MNTAPNIPDGDAFYAALLLANENRTPEQSLAFTLRLCLLLANQIGDQTILMAAVREATES